MDSLFEFVSVHDDEHINYEPNVDIADTDIEILNNFDKSNDSLEYDIKGDNDLSAIKNIDDVGVSILDDTKNEFHYIVNDTEEKTLSIVDEQTKDESPLLDFCVQSVYSCKHGSWYERVYSCVAVPFACTPAVFSDGVFTIHNAVKR